MPRTMLRYVFEYFKSIWGAKIYFTTNTTLIKEL